ncbi:MAG TPA: DUF6701 domain-containing protein, partial [Burkholderiales bacterium]|nr:DUF6701 domain-containing protein [Burkholderiales bacterium]
KLPIPIRLEYWSGSGFVTNTIDTCTTLATSDIALDFTPVTNLTSCETRVETSPITFSDPSHPGVGSVVLSASGAGNNGTVLLTANLNAASGSYCNAGGSYVAASSSNKPYLLGRWSDAADPDGNANTFYDDAASARAGFGLYGSQPNSFIFLRERY